MWGQHAGVGGGGVVQHAGENHVSQQVSKPGGGGVCVQVSRQRKLGKQAGYNHYAEKAHHDPFMTEYCRAANHYW